MRYIFNLTLTLSLAQKARALQALNFALLISFHAFTISTAFIYVGSAFRTMQINELHASHHLQI